MYMVHIYAVTNVNTVIVVNNVNTVNKEPNAIGDSNLMNEIMSFNEEYRASILLIMSIIRGLFESAKWSGHLIIKTHPSAGKIDMDEVYEFMKKLCLTIGNEFKIESSNINKFLDIQKVLTNHSRGSTYTRHYCFAGFVACQKACS